ncbi:hypothetical protein [Saccharospirillum salsuginis]|uniref:Uncharacterized protein n=1 Tax=Saccharospirillum salsuginis TaxID=418750 RepID=A0A918NK74_9GAMM|nr:hypothetical protein [Saccharospirillum salsuginis]GGX74211.1 hypothetical protein GCM10007392_46980 [Saccharospirillum salsuginis]
MTGQLQLGQPIRTMGMTLIPIGHLQIEHSEHTGAFWFHGSLDPVALVIQGPEGVIARDVEGRELCLQSLIERLPELASRLEPDPNRD